MVEFTTGHHTRQVMSLPPERKEAGLLACCWPGALPRRWVLGFTGPQGSIWGCPRILCSIAQCICGGMCGKNCCYYLLRRPPVFPGLSFTQIPTLTL